MYRNIFTSEVLRRVGSVKYQLCCVKQRGCSRCTVCGELNDSAMHRWKHREEVVHEIKRQNVSPPHAVHTAGGSKAQVVVICCDIICVSCAKITFPVYVESIILKKKVFPHME